MEPNYVQCRMEQFTNAGRLETVGWIEERGAKVGARVELKGEDGLWTVISAGGAAVTQDTLKTMTNRAHAGWGSLVDA